MASPARLYQSEMHSNLGFFATWLPGDAIEIGDIGALEGGRFRRETSLRELGVTCKTAPASAAQDVQYTSSGGRKVSGLGQARVPQVGDAALHLEFSHEGAFVFSAVGLQQQSLDNRASVMGALLSAHERGQWKRDWLLVDAVHSANHATVIVSQDSTGGLVLSIKGDNFAASLADPKGGLQVISSQGKFVQVLAAPGLHPLYSCVRIKDPMFGPARVAPVRGTSGVQTPDAFHRPALDELLNS